MDFINDRCALYLRRINDTQKEISTRQKRLYPISFSDGIWGVVAVLYGVKMIFPEWTSRQIECWMVSSEPHFVQADDSVSKHSREVDSLFYAPRHNPIWLTKDGKPVKNRVTSVPTFEEAFPDLNDVQLATASKLGIQSCKNRTEATRHGSKLVI